MYTVNNPSGTPADRKVTLGNAIKAMTITNALSACTDSQTLGGTAAGTGVECQSDDDIPDAADYSNLTGGAGIVNNPTGTIATASNEADFIASGALTCGASTQGKVQVHTTPIQYCDNSATPTLRYAAYGSSAGVATSATALAANPANCSAGSAPLGVDASGAVETCTDYEEDLVNSAGLAAALSDETGTGLSVFADDAAINLDGGTLEIPNSITLPGTCTVGQIYMDTDATTGQRIYACESTNTWALQGDGAGGGSGDITDVFNCSTGDCSSITIAATDLLNLSGSDASTATEGLILPQHATACAGGTAEGQVCWEADANILHIGDAAALKDFISTSAFSGDATVSTTGTVAIQADSVALGTDTTGNYAAGDAEAGNVAADKVLESSLKAVDAAADEECLTYEVTTGDFEWQTCGGAGSGDIESIGDVASGAAFDGTQGTTLTFNNAGGDKTLDYDGTDFLFNAPLSVDATDGADAGAIRLDNAENIAWEAAPAGTDMTLGVDASEILQYSGAFNATALTEGAAGVPNVNDNLSVFAATTSAQLAGVLSDESGTGVSVFGTSPTITTSLSQDGDVADAGYLRLQNAANIAWEASPAGTDVTLGVDSSEILQASGTFNAATLTEGGTGVPNTGDNLSVFAATTSAQLLGVLSDETGTGVAVFATSPDFTTSLDDSSGNELFKLTATASAVNEFTVANAAASGDPVLSATGSDTNIDIALTPKGTGGLIIDSTSTLPSGFATGMLGTPPAAETIAAAATITADACGTIKRITAAGAVTTDTTNTFTAPAAANAGCIMHVCNTGANAITLDNNANFKSAGAADVVVGADDCLIVGSTGASGVWYQITALEAN